MAALLGLTTAEVEAVASFYTMLRLRPTGRHVVSVCTNLSCALRGAKRRLRGGARGRRDPARRGAHRGRLITLHEEECLGACEKAPVVPIDFVYHDDVTPERMRELDRRRSARARCPSPSRGEPMRDFRAASRAAGRPADPQEVDA